MPFSSATFDAITKKIVNLIVPKRCLDIGAGAGKYGRMIREVVTDAYIVGVEIEPDYIVKYRLDDIYDEVYCIDASKLIDDSIDEQYDLAILGDSIEHMRKSDGIDLIHFLVYRTRYILIIYPERYLQSSVNKYKSEAHISVWCEKDFENFEHSNTIKGNSCQIILIAGYLSDSCESKRIFSFLLDHNKRGIYYGSIQK